MTDEDDGSGAGSDSGAPTTADGSPANRSADGTDRTEPVRTAVSSEYKVLGELDADTGVGVLGRNNADSGTPIGVQGTVPNNPTGFGLATPDDARIEGVIDSAETDFVVEAGTTATSDATNVVLGHASNTATNGIVGAVVGGGGYDDGNSDLSNEVSADYATVGGGQDNTASGDYATVGGGEQNTASEIDATVGGGFDNTASDLDATVAGGFDNTASDFDTTVGGGIGNTASAEGATAGGGIGNTASAEGTTVGGGEQNTASGQNAAVGGGFSNTASGQNAAVGGGFSNTAGGQNATVGGGFSNTASANAATAGGGNDNTASGQHATVGGGIFNTANGNESTIGGGRGNRTGKSGTVKGVDATVPGGSLNVAREDYSFAAGRRAKALDPGTFVWADSTDADVSSTGADQFIVEADGGVGLGTNSPDAQLHVRDAIKRTGAGIDTHVAGVENTDGTDGADVLALKTTASTPTEITNFVTFLDAEGATGSIEGQSDGTGITFNTAGADYAEYLPTRDPDEGFDPGEVVGVVDGTVTRATADADAAMVVSGRAAVSGNSPTPGGDPENHELVAFVGQVPATVRGPVEVGDVVVPSGEADGVGRAITPAEFTPEDGPVVGQAWDASDGDGVAEVTVAVGLETGGALAAVVERQQRTIDAQAARIDDLEGRLAALEAQLGSFAPPADD
jgi:hypothetical protein